MAQGMGIGRAARGAGLVLPAALLAGDSIPAYARAAILLFGGSSAAQGAFAAPKLDGGSS